MFKFFDKNKKPENITEVLNHLEKLGEKINKLEKELEYVKKQSKFAVQKVEVIRYNPFSGTGGNQSFSIVLLDGNDDGIVVTSLFTQDGNRVYGKSIKGGESEYTLSKEEKEVIEKAIK